MKVKLLLATVLALTMSASSAVAVPPPGKGKPLTTGPNCKPKVTVVLKGTLAAEPGANSISVTVKQANRHGRAYVTATQPVSVTVNPETTKVRRQGKKELSDLDAGDRVVVQARVCKADLANATPPALTAVRVVAHPASA
jgi:hypothetical protein